jgi:SAM-dependent methyltransferase
MQAFGWEVQGVEVDPDAVAAARARGVSVRKGTLEQQAFPAEYFDAVHSAHVLEHLHDPFRLLRECYRVLKPGGTLVLLTPNVRSLGHREFGAAWLGLDPPRHLMLFSMEALISAARQSGFTIQRLDSTVRIAWVAGALSHRIQRSGRGEMSELTKPAALLRGFAYQLRERWAKRRDPQAGIELRLIARK